MNICVTADSKYMRYLYVMLQSLYTNNREGSIDLYVLENDFTHYDKEMISEITNKFHNKVYYISVDEDKVNTNGLAGIRRSDLSQVCYHRLLIPEILPATIDRVLLLDVDIVVNGDISELYHLDFEGKLLAAAPNRAAANMDVPKGYRAWYPVNRKNWTHYNIGVLMWNLNKIRKFYSKGYFIDRLLELKIGARTFDEELFNVLFGEDLIKTVSDEKWNYMDFSIRAAEKPAYNIYQKIEDIRRNCAIVHYAGIKPWQGRAKNVSCQLWWEYAKMSPFYEDIFEECYLETVKALTKAEKILNYMDLLLNESAPEIVANNLKNYPRVIIYGAGRVARCLYKVLENSEIKIVCYINKNLRNGTFCGKRIIGLDSIKQYEDDTDLIIVSLGYYYDEIRAELEKYTCCKIVSIDDLLSNNGSRKID